MLNNLHDCLAWIQLESTGEEFPSYPDENVGEPFDEDRLVYHARLQHLEENQDMCPPSLLLQQTQKRPHYHITVPTDGTHVALLSHGSNCSIQEKARLASLQIHPPNLVKYLIVYHTTATATTLTNETITAETTTTTRRLGQDDDISVRVLHVSGEAGMALLQGLHRQRLRVLKTGGPKLVLNGSDVRQTYGHSLVWSGFWAVVALCLCRAVYNMAVHSSSFQPTHLLASYAEESEEEQSSLHPET